MKTVVKKFVFAVAIAGILVASISAHDGLDQDKKPPKNPPVVKVGEKPPPTPRPKKPE
jgi:hypothetical protein